MTPDSPDDTFVLHEGRRGSLAFWLVILVAILVAAIAALSAAIARPTADGQGGAGNVVLPTLGAVFALLAAVVVAALWWADDTHFRVVDGKLEARHGTRVIKGRAMRFDVAVPVQVTGEAASGRSRLFLEQGDTRLDLGDTRGLVPDQYQRWEAWLRSEGLTVERRWSVRDY